MGIDRLPRGIVLPALIAWGAARAGTLDLEGALRMADQGGYANLLARSRVDQARARETAAWAGMVPALRAELGAAATDDPMSAFGTRLGQRRISMASFDPASLNDPDAMGGWNAAVVAEIPLVNADAWAGARAAGRATLAQEAGARLELARLHAQVVQAWFAVGLSRQAADAWDTALAVARSYLEQAASGVRNQTALRSDSLRSAVEVDRIRAELAKARTGTRLALGRLALAMGLDSLPGEVPTAVLPDSVLAAWAARDPAAGSSLESEQARLGQEAAREGMAAARGGFLPRVNGVARLDWKARGIPFAEEPSWTVGVVASWSVPGPAVVGADREAAARWREARTGGLALRARDALELESERSKVADALARLPVLRGSLAQAVEAHRIVRRRWEEGLATAAERIEAGALETRVRLEAVSLRQEIVGSLAAIALLEGRDPAELVSLVESD